MFRDESESQKYFLDAVKITLISAIIFILTGCISNVLKNRENIDFATLMIKQSNDWFKTSLQDKEPHIAFQHCNYAVAFLNAARFSSSDTILENISGLDMHKFHAKLMAREASLAKQLKKNKSIKT